MMTKSPPQENQHQALKQVGRSLAGEDRIEDALRIYARILKENPQDVEAYLFMGDLYLAQEDGETALLFYQQAQALAPEDRVIAGRIKLAHLERLQHNSPSAKVEKETRGEEEQKAAPLPPVAEAEIASAAKFMQEVLSSPQPAADLANRLYELEALLPAILELNVRQARAEGQPELAAALQELRERLRRERCELDSRPVESAQPAAASLPRLLFLGSELGEGGLRQTLAAGALSELGCQVTIAAKFPPDFESRFDLVVAQAPHGSPELLPGLAACSAAGIPIVVDLDADFEQMPLNHPRYERCGLGTLVGARAYTASLLLAEGICVPNQAMAASLQAQGYRVTVIPDGWNRGNPLWDKPAAARPSLNIGWIGQDCQIDDLLPVRRILFRIIREFPQVNLVIAGDPQAFQLFDNLPEQRRIYLPSAPAEDRPYLLSQVDLLICPLRSIPYNATRSDRLLVEAGIRRIPWIASAQPSLIEWEAGGLIAHHLDDWHQHLRQLVLDEGLRQGLGLAGRRKAEQREMSRLGAAWMEMVTQARTPETAPGLRA